MQRLFQALYRRLLIKQCSVSKPYPEWLRERDVPWRIWIDALICELYPNDDSSTPPATALWGRHPYLFEPASNNGLLDELGPCVLWRWLLVMQPSLAPAENRVNEHDYYLPLGNDPLFVLSFLSILTSLLQRLRHHSSAVLHIDEVPGFGLGLSWAQSKNPVYLIRSREVPNRTQQTFTRTRWTLQPGQHSQLALQPSKTSQWHPAASGKIEFVQLPTLHMDRLRASQLIRTSDSAPIDKIRHVRSSFLSAEEWIARSQVPDKLANSYAYARAALRPNREFDRRVPLRRIDLDTPKNRNDHQ